MKWQLSQDTRFIPLSSWSLILWKRVKKSVFKNQKTNYAYSFYKRSRPLWRIHSYVSTTQKSLVGSPLLGASWIAIECNLCASTRMIIHLSLSLSLLSLCLSLCLSLSLPVSFIRSLCRHQGSDEMRLGGLPYTYRIPTHKLHEEGLQKLMFRRHLNVSNIYRRERESESKRKKRNRKQVLFTPSYLTK